MEGQLATHLSPWIRWGLPNACPLSPVGTQFLLFAGVTCWSVSRVRTVTASGLALILSAGASTQKVQTSSLAEGVDTV